MAPATSLTAMTRRNRFGLFAVAFALDAVAACSGGQTKVEPAADAGSASSGATGGADAAARVDAARGPDGSLPQVDGGIDSAPQPDAAPPQLVCLASHFVGTVVDLEGVEDAGYVEAGASDAGSDGGTPLEPAHAASHWGLRLPSGVVLAWDDGRAKSYEQTLAEPDLEDTLLMPYVAGPITPVLTENMDPGRIRSDALFKATFGASASQVETHVVDVEFVGQSVKFHERASAALARVSARLDMLIAADPSLAKYVTGALGATYEWRVILNTNRMSVHSFGAAIDIRVEYSRYWGWDGKDFEWANEIPQAVVDAFEAEKFVWGGRWYHYDTMHFEYRPELLDPVCQL